MPTSDTPPGGVSRKSITVPLGPKTSLRITAATMAWIVAAVGGSGAAYSQMASREDVTAAVSEVHKRVDDSVAQVNNIQGQLELILASMTEMHEKIDQCAREVREHEHEPPPRRRR